MFAPGLLVVTPRREDGRLMRLVRAKHAGDPPNVQGKGIINGAIRRKWEQRGKLKAR